MAHTQSTREARRARHKEQLQATTPRRDLVDPQLGRMLTSHIHCGQEMQLVILDLNPDDVLPVTNGARLLTYRCPCGFSFDQPRQ